MSSEFYLVWPMSDEPAVANDEWLRNFLAKHSFPCGHRDFRVWKDRIVVKELGADVPLNVVARPGFNYIRDDMREVLSPEIDRFLQLGMLFDVRHQPFESVRTIWSETRIRIRGGPKSQRRFCPTCGQFIYYPMGQWYVLKRDLAGEPLLLSDMGGLIVNEELYSRLEGKRWRKVDIRPLTVLEKPRDGLPADLTNITAADL